MKILKVIVDELPDTCTSCPYLCSINAYDKTKELRFVCMFMSDAYTKEYGNDDGVESYCPLQLE